MFLLEYFVLSSYFAQVHSLRLEDNIYSSLRPGVYSSELLKRVPQKYYTGTVMKVVAAAVVVVFINI